MNLKTFRSSLEKLYKAIFQKLVDLWTDIFCCSDNVFGNMKTGEASSIPVWLSFACNVFRSSEKIFVLFVGATEGQNLKNSIL